MSEINIVHISKPDAAKRQLEYAIKNFFKNGDVIVTHTLVAASEQILSDLGKKQGIDSFVINWNIIKKEQQSNLRKILREAQNFFKHAKRDREKVLKFNPDQSEFVILNSCMFYRTIVGEITPLIVLFESWMRCKRPNIFRDDKKMHAKLFKNIHHSQKEKFLELLPDLEIAFRINN